MVAPTGIVKKFGYNEKGKYKEKIIYKSAPKKKNLNTHFKLF